MTDKNRKAIQPLDETGSESKPKTETQDDKTTKTHDLIYMKIGEPFPTRKAAILRMGILRKQGKNTSPMELEEGGFVLRVLDEPLKRPKRFDLTKRNILTAPDRPGKHRRFVNDTHDRIEQFLNRGWSIVTEEEIKEIGDPRVGKGTHVGTPVSKNVGLGVTAVLMEIDQEIYDEYQEARRKELNEKERAMTLQPQKEGSYGSVKIGT